MIHCIGDSHSAVFSGKEEMQPIWPQKSDDITPYFKSYRIGPATAYQLESKIGLINSVLTTIPITKEDKILFCFGEVDIRAHLKKQMDTQNRPMVDIVKECVNRYFDVIIYYKENFEQSMMVWGPIASWHESRKYIGGPSFGTCLERNNITKEFNRYLKEKCGIHNITFITIFDNMVDENNITIPEYLDDWEGCHIHLSQRGMPLIIDEFKKQQLI